MDNLIKALEIFNSYKSKLDEHAQRRFESSPTHCEHDELMVMMDPELVSEEDLNRLEELGFHETDEYFVSYRFGSA